MFSVVLSSVCIFKMLVEFSLENFIDDRVNFSFESLNCSTLQPLLILPVGRTKAGHGDGEVVF